MLVQRSGRACSRAVVVVVAVVVMVMMVVSCGLSLEGSLKVDRLRGSRRFLVGLSF